MPTSRIVAVEAPYDPAIADAFARIMPAGMAPLSLFRTMARNPRVLKRMFAGNLLGEGSITLREREILILRTCARCGCEYEWGVHVALFSKAAGLSLEEIEATVNSPSGAAWPAQDAALIRMADELRADAGLSDETWKDLTAHWTSEQIIEMIALCGYYHAISFMANAARLEPESFAARFKQT
jgi:alkylhydroperoxidase family enzyme